MSARYQRIKAMQKEHPLTELCLAFAVSRSGYYDWCARKPSVRQQANTQLLAEIQTLRQSEEAAYGSPRMTEELQARGYQCSENRIARLMHEQGLRAQARPRFVPRTSDSAHDEPIAPNRLAERTAPTGPNQIWLQDITYVPTAQGWLYLALVMDLWSRKIVGWAICAANWWSARCKWPTPSAARARVCWCIRIAACNTPAGKPASFWHATAGRPA